MEKQLKLVIILSLLFASCVKKTASGSTDEFRVVCLAPSAAELVAFVGAQDRIAGVTRFCDYPPELTNLPVVGDMTTVDYEAILRLDPSLVIASYSGNSRESAERLEGMGFEVLTLRESKVADIISNVAILGDVFGTDTIALRESLSDKLEKASFLNALRSSIPPSAMVVISIDPIYAASSDTFVGDVIKLAGYSNVVHSPVAYPMIDRENLLRYAPDVLIVSDELAGEEESLQKMISGLGMDCELIFVDADRLSRPGPRVFDLIVELAER